MPTIYTAIFGNYDELKEPRVITPGWSYICFTDQPFESKVWEVRRLRGYGSDWDKRKRAKLFKICPEIPDFTIYIDGSFIINCNLDEFVSKHHKPGKISMMRHPHRDCVYDEVTECDRLGKDDKTRLGKAREELIKMGVPANNGLAAGGIIIRDGSQSEFCDTWYKNLSLSSRDQISWAVANHLHPNSCHLFNYSYPKGTDFLFVPHNHDKERQQRKLQQYKKQGMV